MLLQNIGHPIKINGVDIPNRIVEVATTLTRSTLVTGTNCEMCGCNTISFLCNMAGSEFPMIAPLSNEARAATPAEAPAAAIGSRTGPMIGTLDAAA
jgi:hypothetical protein